MRVLATVLTLVAVASATVVAPCRAAGVTDIVAKLQARYDDTASFRATFNQEIQSVALAQKLDAWGRVYYRRPGRMRWEFAGPEKQTVVADGKTLWLHQETQRQVVKMQLATAFRTTTPMSFLIGLGRLSDDFEAELIGGPPGDILHLRLRPKGGAGDVGALELDVSAATFDIVGALVTDAAGGTTRWRFSDLERNLALDDALFHFDVPDGVDVVVPPS